MKRIEAADSLGGVRWTPLMMVCFVIILAIVAQMNFAPVLPIIQQEFVITSVWAGFIASATMLSHTMLQMPGGYVTDTLGGKRSLMIGTIITGAALFASGFTTDFAALLACRFVIGIGTAIAFISGMFCASTLGPRNKTAVVQGILGGSASMGVLLGLLTSERLASVFTWRGAFLIEGLAIVFVGLVVPRLLPAVIAKRAVITESWLVTLRQPMLYLLGLAHILTYGVFLSCASWVAVFLWQEHGVGLEWAGPLGALIAVSAVVARTTGGALSVGRERLVIIASCFATAGLLAIMSIVPGIIGVLLTIILLGWFANVAFGAIFAYVTLISDKGVSGREFSIINFVGNIGALTFPPLIGYALDTTGSFTTGLVVVAAVSIIGSVLVAICLPQARRYSQAHTAG